MRYKPLCPNSTCASHNYTGRSRTYIKKGYYLAKHSKNPVPRYQCRYCGQRFSARTSSPFKGDHKPELNRFIMELFCAGVTQRRIAKILRCSPVTVSRKLKKIAIRSRSLQLKYLRKKLTSGSYFQYDELETYINTKLRPVSISIAVEPETRILIALQAAQMPCKGRLQPRSNLIYGIFGDERKYAREEVFDHIKMMAFSGVVHTDNDPKIRHYFDTGDFHQVSHTRNYHKKHTNEDYTPEVSLKQPKKAKHREINPIWMVDHMCARLRADLGLLSRRTWITAKDIDKLQDALDIYIAYHNRLPIFSRRENPRFKGPVPPHPNRERVISADKKRMIWMEENGFFDEK